MAGANDKGHRAKHAVTRPITKDQMKVSAGCDAINMDALAAQVRRAKKHTGKARREMIREESTEAAAGKATMLYH